jgi:hypothetical protein
VLAGAAVFGDGMSIRDYRRLIRGASDRVLTELLEDNFEDGSELEGDLRSNDHPAGRRRLRVLVRQRRCLESEIRQRPTHPLYPLKPYVRLKTVAGPLPF